MSGVDKIIERIMEQANKQREENIAKAKSKADQILEEAKIKANEKHMLFIDGAKKQAQNLKDRLISLAELEAKKKVLGAKIDIIDSAINNALTELVELPHEEYGDLIVKMISSVTEDGEGEIVLSGRDKGRLDESFYEKLRDELQKKGLESKLTISDDVHNFSGGFILRKDKIEINCTFEALIKMKRDVIESSIVNILFDA